MQNNQTPKNSQNTVQDEEIDLIALIATVIDYKWLIILVTGFFAVLSISYVILATPVFEADALIQVEDKQSSMMGFEDMSSLMGESAASITEINLIKSRMIIGEAVDTLKLDILVRPIRFPFIGPYIARNFKSTTDAEVSPAPFSFLSSYDWGGAKIDIPELTVPDAMQSKEIILIAGKNGAYNLIFDDELILEGVVGKIIEKNGIHILVKSLSANIDTQFSLIKLPRLSGIIFYQDEMSVIEDGKDSGMIRITLNGIDPEFTKTIVNTVTSIYVRKNVERTAAEAANSISFLNDQLPKYKEDWITAQNALNDFQNKEKSVDITIETKAVLDEVVALENQISALKFRQFELDKRFTPTHPIYQSLIMQQNALATKKAELENKIKDLPQTVQELTRLSRDVGSNQQMYMQLLGKQQELEIVKASTVGNARIIDNADVDLTRPVEPRSLIIVILATFLGGLFAVALAFAHSHLRRGIESPAEIEALDLPVYASIPMSATPVGDEKKVDRSADGFLSILAFEHPTDPAVEAIRSLRTSLHFAMLEATNNIVMISGPSPGVGKSFISVNSAAMMAQTGKKVLLIDGDMRKGYLHKYFSSPSVGLGLSSLLSKQADLKAVLHSTKVQGLDFISRGSAPPNPSELLLSKGFSEFLLEVSANYDLVIIDTPPILAVADALIVGKVAGASFVVVRFAKNPLSELRAAIKHFERADVRLKGAILNGIAPKALDAYRNKNGYSNYQYAYESAKD